MNEAAFLGGLITHLRFCQFPNTRDNAIRPEQFRRIEFAELFNVAEKFSGEGRLRVMGWTAPRSALMTARRIK